MARVVRDADIVLCLNSGSSSLKFALFSAGDEGEEHLADGSIEKAPDGVTRASLRKGEGRTDRPVRDGGPSAALEAAFSLLDEARLPPPTLAGHRVVHGGSRHVSPERIHPALVTSLRDLVPLAPLHLPAAIAVIEAIVERSPTLPQVACFDTAFHSTLPDVASRFAVPDRFVDAGVRRYGFHGLSYEYIMSVLGASAPPRVVIAHLGNGASLVAVQDGHAVDTTMGLTPTGGIPMGTRTGDLDPGVLLFLARTMGQSVDDIQHVVNHESGLLAIGGTPDMRALLARSASDARARLAVEIFGYAVRKAIGAFAAALGGLDLVVFTGGIGENSPAVRAEACRGLEMLGITLDAAENARGKDVISAEESRCRVRVIATDEDRVVARHTRRLVRSASR
ncbi:MAG: acetate/propionate family kinase [Myxococcota bacterium]|nr:acetate/propionate family kinase [Myxococcota bacterium]